MSKQSYKYSLGLSGEFIVASKLQKMGIIASVTYGNAKKADVIAFSKPNKDGLSNALSIEVKSTSRKEWPVGGVIPPRSSKPWVFVLFPENDTDQPRYFLLKQSELHRILKKRNTEYKHNYKMKHGKESTGRAVMKLKREKALKYENRWSIIIDKL